MSTKLPLLEEMLQLIEELLQNGKKLVSESRDEIREEEIAALEQAQEELLLEIIKKDQLIDQKKYPHSKEAEELRRMIRKKLLEFQKLNDAFYKRLEGRLTMVQFSSR